MVQAGQRRAVAQKASAIQTEIINKGRAKQQATASKSAATAACQDANVAAVLTAFKRGRF